MLSRKPPRTHIQLSRALFASLLCQPVFCVSNCLPPAREMSCQTWKGLSFACHGSDRLGVTTSKKRNREKQWIEAGRTGAVTIEALSTYAIRWTHTSLVIDSLLFSKFVEDYKKIKSFLNIYILCMHECEHNNSNQSIGLDSIHQVCNGNVSLVIHYHSSAPTASLILIPRLIPTIFSTHN